MFGSIKKKKIISLKAITQFESLRCKGSVVGGATNNIYIGTDRLDKILLCLDQIVKSLCQSYQVLKMLGLYLLGQNCLHL